MWDITTGKCVFGGLLENVKQHHFNIMLPGSKEPFGAIQKEKPQGIAAHMTSGLTDADAYEFALPLDMPNEAKANFVSALILLVSVVEAFVLVC
jgi:hypothetical protein